MKMFSIDEVLFFQAQEKYTRVVTADSEGHIRTPLKELLAACRRYLEKAPRDFITFEYVLLDGVNDSEQQARELVQLVRDVPCKFNLIPFNPFPQTHYRRSKPEAIRRFRDVLMQADIVTTTRKTRGDDIAAACGQLAGLVQDKTQRTMQRAVALHG